jgi:hypothetical protein
MVDRSAIGRSFTPAQASVAPRKRSTCREIGRPAEASLEVDHQLKTWSVVRPDIGWFGALDYLVGVVGGTPINVTDICPVRQKSAGHR